MKVCFYHEDFDRDVSSGTSFSMQQWGELLNAFNVAEVAVINKTEDKLPYKFKEYKSLEEFVETTKDENVLFTRAKGTLHFREVNYGEVDWIVFGSNEKWIMEGGIFIPTHDKKELYPREAAAIVLSEVYLWQSH